MKLIFHPLTSDIEQPASSCPGQQSSEDYSSIECFLSALNWVECFVGNETFTDAGRRLCHFFDDTTKGDRRGGHGRKLTGGGWA